MSKKSCVLQLARSDPFMSVDEIAQAAGTTVRYVRTSLSEAGVSLTTLRRRYAEDMKRRLDRALLAQRRSKTAGVEGGEGRDDSGYPQADGWRIADIRLSHVVDDTAARLLLAPPGTTLLNISRLHVTGDRPIAVNKLMTERAVTADQRMFSDGRPLRRSLGFHGAQNSPAPIWLLQAVSAPAHLAPALDVGIGAPLIRLKTIVRDENGKPSALEFYFFAAARIAIEMNVDERRGVRIADVQTGERWLLR